MKIKDNIWVWKSIQLISLLYYIVNMITFVAMLIVLKFTVWQEWVLLFETVTQLMLSVTVCFLIKRELQREE